LLGALDQPQDATPQDRSEFLPYWETFQNKRLIELRRYLTDFSLDSTGKKAQLIKRCEDHYKIQYQAFCKKLKEEI
jgi:hypothetical protein